MAILFESPRNVSDVPAGAPFGVMHPASWPFQEGLEGALLKMQALSTFSLKYFPIIPQSHLTPIRLEPSERGMST